MKAGTQNHVKVRRLKRLLGVPLYQAVGLLETVWLLCSDCCDEGNLGKFTDEEIADYLEWEGPPGMVVNALVEAGWVDRDEKHRLVVHDWLEHCPEFVRERVRKRHMREAKAAKKHGDDQEQRTYVRSEADKSGTTADKTGQGRDKPPFVPSIPNPTQPNPTNSIQEHSGEKAAESPETQPPKAGRKRPAFVAPSVEEVAEYCKKRGNGVNASYFVDYYTSRGWKLSSGQRVQDWQACVRTWEQRSGQFDAPKQQNAPAGQPEPFKAIADQYRAKQQAERQQRLAAAGEIKEVAG